LIAKIPPDGVTNTSIWFNNFDKGEIRPSYYERSLHMYIYGIIRNTIIAKFPQENRREIRHLSLHVDYGPVYLYDR